MSDLRVAIDELQEEVLKLLAENRRLRELNEAKDEALKPFAGLWLYPDDLKEADDIRSSLDWNEEENDNSHEEVFIIRQYIRRARKESGNDFLSRR